MLKAIKKTRIYEEVVGQLQQLIEEGRLKAGDRLPSERELAETFRVSRASVREAIKSLETEGYVTSRPGSGTFIAAVNVEAIILPLASLLSRSKDALLDLFEMRLLIEPGIAALAAARATPPDILRLKEILTDQEHQIKRRTSGVDADTAFHFAIGQATHNSALQRLVASIVDMLKPVREQSLQTPGRAKESLASHGEILTAIERHNPDLARYAMQHHIEAVEHTVLAPPATARRQLLQPRKPPARPPAAGDSPTRSRRRGSQETPVAPHVVARRNNGGES